MVTVKAGALADLVRDIFAKAGCSEAEAGRIGKYLVSADLTGHDRHGVARVPRYLQWKKSRAFFKSARPAAPGGEVLVPGEPERRTRDERLADGVPLPDDTWASIVAAAREVGVEERRIQEAGAA